MPDGETRVSWHGTRVKREIVFVATQTGVIVEQKRGIGVDILS
jgi:hypothetical protein